MPLVCFGHRVSGVSSEPDEEAQSGCNGLMDMSRGGPEPLIIRGGGFSMSKGKATLASTGFGAAATAEKAK